MLVLLNSSYVCDWPLYACGMDLLVRSIWMTESWFNISNKNNPRQVLGLINMGNQEYTPCPRSHVVVGFHSSYAFLENNLVYTMLNPLGKKRVRVYTMPNSLLRETNSLRSIHYALRLATIRYS
jgi:hypothetical protein